MHLNANLLHFYVQIFLNVKFFHLFILRHNHFCIDGYVSFSFSVFLMFYSFILLVRLFCIVKIFKDPASGLLIHPPHGFSNVCVCHDHLEGLLNTDWWAPCPEVLIQ